VSGGSDYGQFFGQFTGKIWTIFTFFGGKTALSLPQSRQFEHPNRLWAKTCAVEELL
jgi:hypothetical protein